MSTLIIPHKHNAVTRFLFSNPIEPIPETREPNIQDTKFTSRFFWSWVFPMLRRGYDRVILPEDISQVPENDAMKHRFGEYKKYLDAHKPDPSTHYREMWALLYAMRWRLFIAFLLKLLATGCEIGMSLITRELIEEAEAITILRGHGSHGPVSGYTIGMCAMDILMMVCDLGSLYFSIMNSELLRTLAMACIHDKMLRLGPQQRYDFSAGKIMTLSSSDCRRASSAFYEINSVLVLPAYFGASIGVLIYMIGVSGLPGVGLLALGLVFCGVASYYVALLRIRSMPYQDRRISLTRETLKNITIIKFYGWEKSFLKLVKGLRAVETKFIRLIEFVDAINVALVISVPNLAGALSFAVKIILSSSLEPSRAFPSLTLFQMFQPIFGQVSFAFISIADAIVAIRRMNTFFRLPEVPSYVEPFTAGEETKANLAARITNGTFSWLNSDAEEEEFDDGTEFKPIQSDSERTVKTVLEDVNIDVPWGTVTLVVGSVGSGKTSLLSAFANTIPKTKGKVQVDASTRITSVLSLWSLSASVRDNILFGLDFNAEKYRRVLDLCDLTSDIELFNHGDATEIGENGVTLSGGQRARLALARCLYADGDLIILDDVLSAMDSRVGNHIFRGLLDLAKNRGKAIVFSTNNLKLARDADFVISLDGQGHVHSSSAQDFIVPADLVVAGPYSTTSERETLRSNEEGSYMEHEKADRESEMVHAKQAAVNTSSVYMPDSVAAMATPALINNAEFVVAHHRETKDHENDFEVPDHEAVYHAGGDSDSDPEKSAGMVFVAQMNDENRAVGSVDPKVLMRYFRLNTVPGFALFATVTLSLMCFACSQSMVNVVLNWWTANRFDKSQGFNLGMYCLVVALVGIFYAVFASSLSFTATGSSTSLHNSALRSLYAAPVSFFQTNPLGRLMMRFTEDMVNLDTRLLAFARMSFMTMFTLIASVLVVFVYVPWTVLCLLPIFLISFVLMAYYRTSSREINRCQQLFDSKSMAVVSEHIEGQEVIMSFDKVHSSQLRINDRLDDAISATLHNEAANFWMALRCGLLCEIINLVTIFLAVFQIFNLNAAEVGMLISILPNVRTSLIMLFPMYALFDNQLNSVERLDEYALSVDSEGIDMAHKMKPELSGWNTTNAAIEFQNVSLRYRPDLPLVLNDFSISIGGGKKIGICGRTGAGKSTIISALFRLVELEQGAIKIDGQDISELPLDTLRRALAIIPQQPVLFQGTIRSNLDPFEEHDDDVLTKALELAGIPVHNADQKFALAADVQSEGTNFSMGERQMLALARAIVRDAKILVLDEATAAVDQATDERIQRTIKSVFSHCTVFCIAHRLETILDYDEILVMGPGGRMLEMGEPRQLWAQNGVFKSMCREAGVSM